MRLVVAKETSFHRKLAAILAADVVGYSRMMEADEVGTLRQVQSVQRTCITPITATYGGRLIKTTGDGFLFEFSSAVDAILFALAFQKRLQTAMASVPEAKRLVFRVGVHAGDVLSDGADMFGDGVNVAARLETLCVPGGICMSAVVQQQLHGKIDLPLIDLGEHQVKNITRAIHVFGLDAAAIEQTKPIAPDAPVTRRTGRWRLVAAAVGVVVMLATGAGSVLLRSTTFKIAQTKTHQGFSIAVLPFTSLNADAKPDSFADALVDNLTTDLSIGFPASSVISSASTFTYRGKSIDPREVGRELGANYLLEGSLQRFSDRLRINVQLIDAESAGQLWSDQFEGPLSDIADLQDKITVGIANTLSVQLVRLEADRQKFATDASAIDLFFRGAALMTQPYTTENATKAEADFRQALVLDPNNLMAMKALGALLAVKVGNNLANFDDKTQAQFAEAQHLLDRVRAQNPRSPGLHNDLGFVAFLLDKPYEAMEHYRTEIDIDPSAASAYAGLGLCLIKLGRAGEAVPLIEKSIRLDPRNPGIYGNYEALTIAYFALGKYPEAIEQGQHAYNVNPTEPNLLYYLAAANAMQGNDAEAKARLAEARKLDPSRTLAAMRRQISATEPADVALANRYIEALRRAGLPN